jgi:hypothetical protein
LTHCCGLEVPINISLIVANKEATKQRVPIGSVEVITSKILRYDGVSDFKLNGIYPINKITKPRNIFI